MTLPAFTFVHPSNILFAGPSGAGKTTFLIKALKKGLFQPRPTRVVWIFGESQGAHHELEKQTLEGKLPRIEYMRNDTDYNSLKESFDSSEVNLLVLDDQMNQSKTKSTEFSSLFTQGSHHRNITIVYLVQNVFEKGGANRTVSLNSHYMVLFKNPRDKLQIQVLGRQMYPEQGKFLAEAFKQATETGFSCVVLDLRQETPDELRVLSNVLESVTYVYVPNKFKDI